MSAYDTYLKGITQWKCPSCGRVQRMMDIMDPGVMERCHELRICTICYSRYVLLTNDRDRYDYIYGRKI